MTGKLRSFRENLVDMMYAKIDHIKLFIKPFAREEFAFRFHLIVQPRAQRLDDARELLCAALRDRLFAAKRRLELAAQTLESGNPRAIMERGYAVVTHRATNALIKRASEVRTGDRVTITFMEGEAAAEITGD